MRHTRLRHLTHRPLKRTVAGAAVAAIAASALGASPAAAASPVTSSAAAQVLAGLAYRGAEHPYAVADVAGAQAAFGVGSPQDKAASAALATNVSALVSILGGATRNASTDALSAALGKRDQAELSYAAIASQLPATAALGTQAVTSLRAAEGDIANLLSARLGTPAADLKNALTLVDDGDLVQLQLVAVGSAGRYPGALKGADASAALFTSLATAAAKASGATGDLTKSPALYLRDLTVAFTEHVRQTGLTAQGAIMSRGTYTTQAKAALKAEDGNSQRIAQLLGYKVLKVNEDLAAWRSHINSGYTNVIDFKLLGDRKQLRAGNAVLAAYVNRISADIHAFTPGLTVDYLKAAYTDHTSGTEVVINQLVAGSPLVYATAAEGTMHFAELAGAISQAAEDAGNV